VENKTVAEKARIMLTLFLELLLLSLLDLVRHAKVLRFFRERRACCRVLIRIMVGAVCPFLRHTISPPFTAPMITVFACHDDQQVLLGERKCQPPLVFVAKHKGSCFVGDVNELKTVNRRSSAGRHAVIVWHVSRVRPLLVS
jgi:hypothetical protein